MYTSTGSKYWIDKEFIPFSKDDPLGKLRAFLGRYIDAPEEELTILLLQLFSGVDKVTPDGIAVRGNISVSYLDLTPIRKLLLKAMPGILPRLYGRPRILDEDDYGRTYEHRRSRMDNYCDIVDTGYDPRKARNDKVQTKPLVIIGDYVDEGRAEVEAPKEFQHGGRNALPATSVIKIGYEHRLPPHHGNNIDEELLLSTISIKHYDAVFGIGREEEGKSKELAMITSLHGRARDPEDPLQSHNLVKYLGAETPSTLPPEPDSRVLDVDFVSDYIIFARERCRPELEVDLLDQARQKFEKLNTIKDAVVSNRHLGTLIRFAEASARSRLSEKVEGKDLELAFKLLTYWTGRYKEYAENKKKGRTGHDDIEHDKQVTRIQEPRFGLAEVVIPEGQRLKLGALLAQARSGKTMFEDWGLSETVRYGKGTVLLFYGPPGTGKTMAAEAVAKELGKKLLIINNAAIVSCWYGTSSRNIVEAFEEAKRQDAVLLFDEVDSLLTARVSVRHSTDMAINREVNTILGEIEKFEGVVVMTTNMHLVLDEALDRRINLKLELTMPDASARAEIWRRHISPKTPLAKDVDFNALGREFEISGGLIKNAILNAARLAIFKGKDRIDMVTLREAADMELGSGTAGITNKPEGYV